MEDNYALRERYNLLKGVEHQKNGLIEVRSETKCLFPTDRAAQELLHRIDQLTNDFHQEKLDHARESHFNREVQQREINLQDELRRYKNAMVSYPRNGFSRAPHIHATSLLRLEVPCNG